MNSMTLRRSAFAARLQRGMEDHEEPPCRVLSACPHQWGRHLELNLEYSGPDEFQLGIRDAMEKATQAPVASSSNFAAKYLSALSLSSGMELCSCTTFQRPSIFFQKLLWRIWKSILPYLVDSVFSSQTP